MNHLTINSFVMKMQKSKYIKESVLFHSVS